MGSESEQQPKPDSNADQAFRDYSETRTVDDSPAMAEFESALTPGERVEFRQLTDALDFVKRNLPASLRADRLLEGRYRLVEVIGSGGMGQVWRALDEKLDKMVAVKVLNLIAVHLDAASTVEREMRLLARLDHPGIVSILESGTCGDERYIVMDLIEGASLATVIGRLAKLKEGGESLRGSHLLDAVERPVEPGRTAVIQSTSYSQACAEVMIEILRTLEATHARGVVHRDLKPANIMLRGGANPVLLDFGLGGFVGQAPGAMTSKVVGTVPYVAPEQWESGAIGADPRTDIYQLGLILYELLVLRQCFSEETFSDTVARITEGRFERPRQIERRIPSDLERVCLRAMELSPDRRYATADEFRVDLERFLRGEPLVPSGNAVLRDLRYFVRCRRRPLLAVAGLALAVVGTMGTMWWLDPGKRTELVAFQPTGEQRRAEFVLYANEPQTVHACILYELDGEQHIAPLPLRLRGDSRGKFAEPEEGVFAECDEDGSTKIVAELPDVDASYRPVRISVVMTTHTSEEAAVRKAIAGMRDALRIDHSTVMEWSRAENFWRTASRGILQDGREIDLDTLLRKSGDEPGISGRGMLLPTKK